MLLFERILNNVKSEQKWTSYHVFSKEFWSYYGTGTTLTSKEYHDIHEKTKHILRHGLYQQISDMMIIRDICIDSFFRDISNYPTPNRSSESVADVLELLNFFDKACKEDSDALLFIVLGILQLSLENEEAGFNEFGRARMNILNSPHTRHHLGALTAYREPSVLNIANIKKNIVSSLEAFAKCGNLDSEVPFSIYFTVDPVFFMAFGRKLLSSILLFYGAGSFAVTILDADSDFMEWAANILSEFSSKERNFECFLYGQKVIAKDSKPVYASARFLNAEQILRDVGRDLLIVDGDLEAIRSPGPHLKRKCKFDIGLNINDGFPSYVPWKKINASQVFLKRNSMLANSFIENFARYFYSAFDLGGSNNWWIDQNALRFAFYQSFRADYSCQASIKNLRYASFAGLAQQKHGFKHGIADRKLLIKDKLHNYLLGKYSF